MDKQILASSQGLTNTSNYAICALKDGVFLSSSYDTPYFLYCIPQLISSLSTVGELHLTPVSGVLQIRPSFAYLDKSDSQLQKSAQIDGGEASQEEEEPETTITVKFARRETDRVKQAREKSFAFLQAKLEEEPWKRLTIHSASVRSLPSSVERLSIRGDFM